MPFAVIWAKSRPATRMVPAVGSSSLISSRISVDLPEPDGPTRNTKSPRATLNVACSTPTSPESYSLATPRNSITGRSAASRPGTGPTAAGLGGGGGVSSLRLRGRRGVEEIRRDRVGAAMGVSIRGGGAGACKGPCRALATVGIHARDRHPDAGQRPPAASDPARGDTGGHAARRLRRRRPHRASGGERDGALP